MEVEFHRIGEVTHFLELVAGHVTRGSLDEGGDAVHDGRAGVLDGRGFHHVVFEVRLALDPPIAHIPVIRPIDLADRLFLDLDALGGLDGHHRGHADAAAGLDGFAKRRGLEVMVDDIGDVLLLDGDDGEASFEAMASAAFQA